MRTSNEQTGPLRSLPASVPAAGYWEWNIDEGSVFFSDRLLDVLGLQSLGNELTDEDVLGIVHPDDRPGYIDALKRHLAGESEVFSVEVRVVTDTGALRWVVNRGALQRGPAGEPARMSGTITDITAQRKLEDAIRFAASSVSNATGPGFFQSLTRYLAKSLNCDLSLVGRLENDERSVRTLGACSNGEDLEEFRYQLDVSPCRNVVGRETCLFPRDVWRHYPDDVALVEGRFEGYAGTPLFDSFGRPIGLIAVLFRDPIDHPDLVRDVLSIFAFRAAAEIERSEREQALLESERRFRDFAAASADHFWETDEHHRFSRLQDWVEDFLGLTISDMLGRRRWELRDASPLDDDGWERHIAVLDAHREFRDFQFRVTSESGEQKVVSVSGVPVFDGGGEFRGYRGTATDVTGQVRAEQSEREAQERLKLAVEAADLYVWDWEVGAERTNWRTDPERLLGPRPEGGYPDFTTMVFEDDRQSFVEAYRRSTEAGASYAAEFRIRRTDGCMRWLSVKGIVVRGADGRPARLLGITQDVTARRENEERLRLSASVFSTREPIMITDATGVILDVNDAFLSLFGYDRDAVLGRTPALLQSGHHDDVFYRDFWERLKADGYWQGEMLNRASDGRIIPNWMVIDAVVNEDGEVYRYVATCNDISERKQAEERIQKLAWYDPLTQLPNRRLLSTLLQDAISEHRTRAAFGGVMLIDLDDFKTVNQSLGYRTGDALLSAVGRLIGVSIGDSGKVARAGSDEFAVLLPDLGANRDLAVGQLQERADALTLELSRPLDARGEMLRVSCSIGIHVFPEGGLGASEFLSQCEMALHRAKRAGHGSARFYHPEMKRHSDERLRTQLLLASILDGDRIENHYQVQVDATARIVGVEALARLRADDGALLEPARFIPVAEETGLIFLVGEQVLRRALLDMKTWLEGSDFAPEFVAVNVSPRQFLHENFVAMVNAALADTGLPGSVLELEITENLLVEDFDRVISVMATLKTRGVRFAIDDFGTGYSSLAYLNRLPIDKLKIDRSFVARLEQDEASRAIVSIILSMARTMKLKVVAEGVETDGSRQTLEEWGCVTYQGFLFDRPVPARMLTFAPTTAAN